MFVHGKSFYPIMNEALGQAQVKLNYPRTNALPHSEEVKKLQH
jgi:hypothetical protein